MKIQVTVVSKTSLASIAKGTKLYCEKEKDNKFDAKAIKVSDGTDDIGYISSSAKTTVAGCVPNKSIYDSVGDKFEITVARMDSIVGRTEKAVIVASLEIEGASGDSTSGSGIDVIYAKCKIKGSSAKYPNKKSVIQKQNELISEHETELSNGNRKHKLETLLLTAKLDDDNNIVVYYDGKLAGVVDETMKTTGFADITMIQDVKTTLSELGEMECQVTGRADLSFYSVEFAISKETLKDASVKTSKRIVETIKSDLVDKGFEEETLSNIEDVLLAAGLSANQIKAWFETFEVYPAEEQALIPVWEDVSKYVDNQGHVKLAAGAILKGKHLNLLGEKGTGKNTFADYMLYLAQRPKHELSGNGQTSKAEFFGEPTIDSHITDTGNVAHEIEFNPEQFVQAMGYKEDDSKRHAGGCALIDEANGIPADVLLSLNSSADARRAVTVPGYGRVNAGKNFFIMLTMNIGYEGTRNLNEAFKDRFVPIRFDSNDSIEQILAANCPDAKREDIKKANKIYQKMNSLIKNNDGELDSSCITIRGFIDALDLVEFVGLKESLIRNVADRILDDDDYRQKTIDIIEAIVG